MNRINITDLLALGCVGSTSPSCVIAQRSIQESLCQAYLGSMSNCVEIATRWYKPQEHLSPVDLDVSQTIRDALEHLDFGIAPFCKAVGGVIVKVIQYRLTPAL